MNDYIINLEQKKSITFLRDISWFWLKNSVIKSVCGANEVDKIDSSKIEYFLRVSVCGKIF